MMIELGRRRFPQNRALNQLYSLGSGELAPERIIGKNLDE